MHTSLQLRGQSRRTKFRLFSSHPWCSTAKFIQTYCLTCSYIGFEVSPKEESTSFNEAEVIKEWLDALFHDEKTSSLKLIYQRPLLGEESRNCHNIEGILTLLYGTDHSIWHWNSYIFRIFFRTVRFGDRFRPCPSDWSFRNYDYMTTCYALIKPWLTPSSYTSHSKNRVENMIAHVFGVLIIVSLHC